MRFTTTSTHQYLSANVPSYHSLSMLEAYVVCAYLGFDTREATLRYYIKVGAYGKARAMAFALASRKFAKMHKLSA